MTLLRRLIVLMAICVAPAVWPAVAEPVYPTGLRVGLEPIDGLVLSKRFPGFEDPDRNVAVSILDLPGPAYEELNRSAFAENQPGLQGIKRESFGFANGIGMLGTAHATQDGVTVHKWILLATAVGGPESLTTLVNVQVPETARAVYTDEAVRKMLASVTFRRTPVAEQVSLLPFKLDDMAGFRVMQALPAGGVILTEGPTDNINKQPYMIVAIGRGSPADRGRFANDLLSSAPLRDLNVNVSEGMRIGGQPGYEIRARATGLTGEPVSLVQWVRFGGSGFLRIIGVAPPDQWDAMFTRFRAVRDGIDIK